jgi:hypothetical protein
VDLKRLGSVLALAQELESRDFESLLLLKGLGPRTIQSLTLVSEMIHGTPTRFRDPARFSFAHGGKDGHPFPVPTRVYDEVISTLQGALRKARIGESDKKKAIQNLHRMAAKTEEQFVPSGMLDQLIEEEQRNASRLGGRTVFDDVRQQPKPNQLRLFD